MKCKKCRKTIPDGSKFCNHCGTPTEKKKLYRRPDGLYEKVLTIDGKRVAFRAKKEKDVYIKIANYEEKKEKGLNFREVAELWKDEHRETLSESTWAQCYDHAYNEVVDYFGDDYVSEITHKDIKRYMEHLPRTFARKTCSTRLNVINMILKFAVVEDMIADNPCSYITVPKGHGSSKRRAPTSDEFVTIKSNSIEYKNFPVGFLAVFLLYTGCRKGEALALTFGDVDRTSMRIHITKSVYYQSNQGYVKKPKTEAGNREIIIPQTLLPLLPDGKKNDLIFCRYPGEIMKKDFFDKAWRHWREQTGLDLTAHQLRHGYATLLHEADVDVKDAQDLLGHADASTTQNIYTEVSKKSEADRRKTNQ